MPAASGRRKKAGPEHADEGDASARAPSMTKTMMSLASALEECQHSASSSAHRRIAALVAPQRSEAMALELARMLRPVSVRACGGGFARVPARLLCMPTDSA